MTSSEGDDTVAECIIYRYVFNIAVTFSLVFTARDRTEKRTRAARFYQCFVHLLYTRHYAFGNRIKCRLYVLQRFDKITIFMQ